jgi:hypothetical protein
MPHLERNHCHICNGRADSDDISYTCTFAGPLVICRHCAVTAPLCNDPTCAPEYRCIKPEYSLLNALDEQLDAAVQRWQREQEEDDSDDCPF